MQELLNIFNEISADSSRTGKEAILVKNKDNKLFVKVLKFLYNPFILTGISTKKLKKKVTEKYDISNDKCDNIESLMNYLLKNNTGRDYDIAVVQDFIDRQDSGDIKKFVEKIVSKSLKIGITSKTVNKAYPENTIPSFSVMLAESYEKKESKLSGTFYVTQKLDGNRVIGVNSEDGVKFFTRSGMPIEGMAQLEKELSTLPTGWVFDGEVLLINDKNLSSDDLFRATQRVIRKDGEKNNLEFHVFDSLLLTEFKIGMSIKTYAQRRNNLELVFNNFNGNFIKLLPVLYKGEDKGMVSVLMKYAEEKEWEGLMVNTTHGLYQSKRTSDLLKVKKFKSADLACIGIEEGLGKNEGKLGALMLSYKDGVVKVGSGFSDEERSRYWNNPDEVVGKIIEVSYFEESSNQDGGESLRFPVFKTIRTDKGIDDVNIE